jgi:hypothetical protein
MGEGSAMGLTEPVAVVPHDPLFDDPWLKWGRACVHAQALQADLDAFGANSPFQPTFAVRTEYQPKRHGFAVTVTDIDPMPPTWGLILGDVANNLRSALDQLAWAIVTRGKTPPDTLSDDAQRRIYFPICEKPSHFKGVLAKKLPGATWADIARVRRYQPYKHRAWRYVLPLLAEINIDDKHRTVQPVWAVPMTADIEVTYERDCIVRERDTIAKRKVLEVDTELGFVRARKTGPQPHIEVVPHLTSEPSFKDRRLVKEWLRVALWWTQWLLYEFSEPPDKIGAVGIDLTQLRTLYDWQRPPTDRQPPSPDPKDP